MITRLTIMCSMLLISVAPTLGQQVPTREQALDAMRRAATFFKDQVAVEGGYVWRYSDDLARREGEGKVGLTTVWIQPPATPSVGEAFVTAYELTGDPTCLEAAKQTAHLLVRGQMHSGGWDASIELDPEARRRHAYRIDGKPGKNARLYSSLDDDKTQSALRFLIRYHHATQGQDESAQEAMRFGLDSLIGAQFPNGGWTQVFTGPADADAPVLKAGYRETGEDTHIKAYWFHYTLNDHLVSDVADTLLLAHAKLDDEQALAAARRAGDFLILAQMPEPQPAWAQQYDRDMKPAWARKFEPAAMTGSESQSAIHTMMDLYVATRDEKYLEPILRAIAYLKRSQLADGRLARFYELKTNRPLYFTREYKLTYDDSDLPTHYGFKVSHKLDSLERRYQDLKAGRFPDIAAPEKKPSADTIRRIIDSLDERGAWVEDGTLRYWGKDDPTRRIISPKTFADNLVLLARYAGLQP